MNEKMFNPESLPQVEAVEDFLRETAKKWRELGAETDAVFNDRAAELLAAMRFGQKEMLKFQSQQAAIIRKLNLRAEKAEADLILIRATEGAMGSVINDLKEKLLEYERLHSELNDILHPNGDGPTNPSLCDLVAYVKRDLEVLFVRAEKAEADREALHSALCAANNLLTDMRQRAEKAEAEVSLKEMDNEHLRSKLQTANDFCDHAVKEWKKAEAENAWFKNAAGVRDAEDQVALRQQEPHFEFIDKNTGRKI